MPSTFNLEELIERFNDDFSSQRLDQVMSYFAEQSEFKDLNGKTAKGKNAITKAFQRLFDGAYGKVTFIPKNMIVDQEKRQASFVWACQHEMLSSASLNLPNKFLFKALKMRNGSPFFWHGVDYFIFDEELKIISKQTHGKAAFPQFIKGHFSNK
ncbi:hypothetical protein A3715_12805 [Oleiphilus sp. HI0009]|uniref:YybH family protein n=1 Tax=unclassified Oleiphilus TaxID=2631174 RepID=UPI0007C2E4D5|nr:MULTISPECIES: nuclear transport factor 2 family protein [unclassified Oleiphilus]KZX76378.1 hypothetical protein A3715_12805 [Oleiphilus sp. HI0009]KZY71948.1 hypothetical protein A3739_03505 [Oleiphilus sp. HI0067]KZY72259.1 hypothetical protein A3738_03070 [Oleiphilus sp. HI0066]